MPKYDFSNWSVMPEDEDISNKMKEIAERWRRENEETDRRNREWQKNVKKWQDEGRKHGLSDAAIARIYDSSSFALELRIAEEGLGFHMIF